MAKRKLDIFLGMDNAELKTKLNESKSLLSGFQATIGGIIGGAALGVSIKSLGDFALNASKNFEQAQISFSKMLQSEKAGQTLINDIQKLANETPMTSESLNNNAKLLLNFNAVAADEVIPTLKMLGDITGGDKQRMDSLTLAFAQSASAGRLMGQDLLQMINAGFNPLQIMSEKTGKSIGTLKDEMSKGKISFDQVIEAFKAATEAGGKFNGMMEAQAKSKAGLEATKADSYEILARTIMDKAMPALKEFDQAQIDIIRNATEAVSKIGEWAEINNQTTNAITNTGLAITTAVLGYTALATIVSTISKVHLESIAAIQAYEVAQAQAAIAAEVAAGAEQALYAARLKGDEAMIKECVALRASTAAKAQEAAVTASSTQATVLQYVATGNLTKALKLATAQTLAFTTALLTNPLTYVALAIAGVTAAVFAMKNSIEKAEKAVEDINNTFEQNTNAIESNIKTVNNLVDVQNKTVSQENELRAAVDNLIKIYPQLEGKLTREQILRNGINKEIAKQILLTQALQKQQALEKQKKSTDYWVAFWGRSDEFKIANGRKATDRMGVPKKLQIAQDQINKDLKDVNDLINKIENNEVNLGFDEEKRTTKKATSGGSSMTDAEKRKAERAAEKARKEAIALKTAQIDAQILQVKKNSDEEYKLELAKVDAKIALEKKGTAKYQEALNERTKLVQKHTEEVAALEIQRYNNKAELENLNIEREKELLEREKQTGAVSNEEYYNRLIEFEDRKYQIKLDGLNKQLLLYDNDVNKVNEINQEKLILEAEYQNEKLRLSNEAVRVETENWKQLFNDVGNSFSDSLGQFLSGNQTLKDSFLNIFSDIKSAFFKMIAEMLVEQAKLAMFKGLTSMIGGGGFLGTAAGFLKNLFFAEGGIIPGQYNQAMPVVAHGSEMVLNPLQQKNLWNMIASGNNAQAMTASNASNSGSQPVIVNNITPIFQSLDPNQGQKLFQDWMKQSGLPMVRDSIKNNNNQMRDVIKGVG